MDTAVRTWVWLVVGLAVVIIGGGIYAAVTKTEKTAMDDTKTETTPKDEFASKPEVASSTPEQEQEKIQLTTMVPGLQYADLVVGTGAEAVAGKQIAVHYTGRFTDGKVFDSSVGTGKPLAFVLGTGRVIQGWDKGFAGMKVGGKRVLVVAPELGYGAQGYGPIPGNTVLVFEVELVAVQ